MKRNALYVLICGLIMLAPGRIFGQTPDRWPFRSPMTEAPKDTVARFLTERPFPVISVSQVLEGALSDSYIIGPGDGLLISIWGKKTEHFQTVVTPEGRLFIPQISEIAVAGLTLAELRKKLADEIARYFFDVRVDATLIQLRQFQVYVLGAVARPGLYPAHAIDRVSQLVERAGGLIQTASSRNIEIRRNGKTAETSDLLSFSLDGDFRLNPYVRDGDIVYVPLRTRMVGVDGAVWEPGRYELREGDRVETLIRLARGLRPEARREEAELARFNQDALTTGRFMLDLRDSTGADWSMTLKPDDRLFVRSVTRWHERLQVTVSGEARYPGSYVIDRDSTTLRAVIDRAGGFTAEASLQESFVLRANTTISIDPEYERLKLVPAPDMTPDEYEYFKMKSRERRGLLTVDFQRLFKTGDVSQDVVLKNGDQIFIEKNRETVVVTGAVASPGGVIYNPRLTVNDYILRAGGYGWNARRNKTRVIRAKTGEWVWAGKAGILGPGDTVWVPEKPYRDWWNIFLQGLTTAGQVATIILVIDTVRR